MVKIIFLTYYKKIFREPVSHGSLGYVFVILIFIILYFIELTKKGSTFSAYHGEHFLANQISVFSIGFTFILMFLHLFKKINFESYKITKKCMHRYRWFIY